MANHVTSFITFENLSDKAEEFLENMNDETLLQGLYSDYDNTYDWYIDNVGAKVVDI
jgi:NADPH-dependent curcumin reductase CurA